MVECEKCRELMSNIDDLNSKLYDLQAWAHTIIDKEIALQKLLNTLFSDQIKHLHSEGIQRGVL